MIVARHRAKEQLKRFLVESRVLDRSRTYDLRNDGLLLIIQLIMKEILVSLIT